MDTPRETAARGAPGSAPTPLVVFYDGDCGLCTRFVAWAMARAPGDQLRPVPAQSEEAWRLTHLEPARLLQELHVWREDAGTDRGVDAIAAVLSRIPNGAVLGNVVRSHRLRPLPDALYRLVARNRAWFGAARCPLPERRAR